MCLSLKIKAIKLNLCQLHAFTGHLSDMLKIWSITLFSIAKKNTGFFVVFALFIAETFSNILLSFWNEWWAKPHCPMPNDYTNRFIFLYTIMIWLHVIRFRWIVCVYRLNKSHLNTKLFLHSTAMNISFDKVFHQPVHKSFFVVYLLSSR